MKPKIVLSFLYIIFASYTLLAQYQITIDVLVLDAKTKKPVPYVNVGFVGKGIGTVSDQKGHVFLQYDEQKITEEDVLQLSSLGYQTVQFSVKQLFKMLSNNNKLFLEPSIFELEEATVLARKRKKKTIGNAFSNTGRIGYWKDKLALGGEIATRIKIRNKNSKLLNLHFNIHENITDSLLVRVNVYGLNKQKSRKNKDTRNVDHVNIKKPGNNLLTSNIYHTIRKKKGRESIDLSPYNIEVNEDIVVSLELIKVYGDDIQFSISASKEGRSYLRYISQDQWKGFHDVGMAFNLDISYPSGKMDLKKREKPQNLVIYWDTSLSVEKNDITKTISFLKEYIKKIKEVKVTLVTFSDTIHHQKVFEIRKGATEGLITSIKNVTYHGATNYSVLFNELEVPDQYLVITDGYATYGLPKPVYNTPIFYVNDTNSTNDLLLQESAIQSEGHYLNLSKIQVSNALSKILNEVEDNTIYNTNTEQEQVQGVVSSNGKPIQGCEILVKGSLTQVISDVEGKFSINAINGDVLVFDFFGMITKEVPLDATKSIAVDLLPAFTVLDEVSLQKDKDQSSNEKVDIGGAETKKRALGFANYTLEEKDFPKSAIYLSDLIRARFPGVQVKGFADQATYTIRGNSSFTNGGSPLFLVDGAQYLTPPIFLFPSQIKRISVISGLSGRARFGNAGSAGVFLITTKNNIDSIKSDEKPINDLLVKGNDYKESNTLIDTYNNRPSYLDPLWDSKTYVEAKKRYKELRVLHRQEVPFYVHCSSYFERWDPAFSEQIISNIAEIGFDNPQALRVLAFKLEAAKKMDIAMLIYERILSLRPESAQSYIDMARIYTENGKYQPAFELYKMVLQNEKETTDFEGIAKQAESEIKRLLNLHRSKISYHDVPEKFLGVKGVPIRLVFEWSDPQAEFEIQFVNPIEKYYKWQHVFRVNKEELLSEVKTGVLSKEFSIDRSIKGQWTINLQSFGAVSLLNPEFMKYTIYTNYGLQNETKKVQFINLYNQKGKVTLDKIAL